MARTFKDYLFVTAKGVAMGAADVVPGVSGGTIAFISGIYEELLGSIKSVNPTTLKLLFKEGIGSFWKAINGNFLVALFAGIAISVVSLAKAITYLLDTYPHLVWGFFFGLILASIWFVGKTISKFNLSTIIPLLMGTVFAYWITILEPSTISEQSWFVFVAGAIAICAMILPGISGSFILLLMGMYSTVLGAIKDMNLAVIALFGAGCVTGLLSFSHVLSWLLKHHYNTAIALLTGFMLGSLNKVWPWKITTEFRINSHGEEVPFLQENILPSAYEGGSQVLFVVALMIVGFCAILLLEKLAKK